MRQFALTLLLLFSPLSILAETTGEFLALRHAFFEADDPIVAGYVERIMEQEVVRPTVREEAVLVAIYSGDLKKAAELAATLPDGDDSFVVAIAQLGIMIQEERFFEAAKWVEENDLLSFAMPEIFQAWGLALDGDLPQAQEILKEAMKLQPEWLQVIEYQQAMILANLGEEYAEAADILENEGDTRYLSEIGFYNHMALYALAGDERYVERLNEQFGPQDLWPRGASVIIDLAKRGRVDNSLGFSNPQSAIAEYLSFLLQASRQAQMDYGVERLIATMIPALAPENDWQRLQLVNYFRARNETDDVILFTDDLQKRSAWYVQLGRMRTFALFERGRDADARAFYSKAPDVYFDDIAFKADSYRSDENYAEAAKFYEQITEKEGTQNPRFLWLRYGLAMCRERLGEWPAAQEQFDLILEFAPDEPDVLNYYGYSLVDRGERLQEGMAMIRKATELEPSSPYIIDSLGWAHYRLGEYQQALEPLETAILLDPVEPVINSHLGDLYWRLGREREAGYQWKRALLFLEEDNQDLTRAQLEERLAKGLPAS